MADGVVGSTEHRGRARDVEHLDVVERDQRNVA
jgi:hypothetical protein